MITKQQRHERARDDARTSNDFARAAAQATILINGGAATAILAFFSNVIHDGGNIGKSVLPLMPTALATYALGVFVVAVALPFGSRALEYYMTNWERDEGEKMATRLWNITLSLVVCGLLCFVISSICLAYGLHAISANSN